jgi:hypothetical protein
MADVESFLDGLAGLTEPVTVHFLWRPQLCDAADEMVLEAAGEKLAKCDGTGVNQFVVQNCPHSSGGDSDRAEEAVSDPCE